MCGALWLRARPPGLRVWTRNNRKIFFYNLLRDCADPLQPKIVICFKMSPPNAARNNPRNHSAKRLQSGAELHAWRVRMEVSAKELAKLIGVTERSIHHAERTGKLGSKVKLGMELLQSRMAHGEIDLPSALGAAPRRGRPRKEETLVVREEPSYYGSHWHGELRTGTDLRRWRKQVGLYQKELAKLLNVTPPGRTLAVRFTFGVPVSESSKVTASP